MYGAIHLLYEIHMPYRTHFATPHCQANWFVDSCFRPHTTSPSALSSLSCARPQTLRSATYKWACDCDTHEIQWTVNNSLPPASFRALDLTLHFSSFIGPIPCENPSVLLAMLIFFLYKISYISTYFVVYTYQTCGGDSEHQLNELTLVLYWIFDDDLLLDTLYLWAKDPEGNNV